MALIRQLPRGSCEVAYLGFNIEMHDSVGPRVIFVAREKEWYADLVDKMKKISSVDHLAVPYYFEQQHSSKINVLVDSVFLLFYFPMAYLIKGRGLYFLTTRHLPILFWFRILSMLGMERKVVAMNFYFHGMRNKAIVRKILKFLLDNKNLTVIAPSKNDYDYFLSLSSKVNLHYVIFGLEKSAEDFDVKEGDYIFCGGYNNRDFDLVFDVAEEMDEKFVIITSGRARFVRPPSSNIELLQDVEHDVFDTRLASAKIVLIPLKDEVGASGQIVALTAMLCGKPVIYTDYDVVAEYFEDGVTGLACKAGSRKELMDKINRLIENASLRKKLGDNARATCDCQFTSDATNRSIVDVVSQVVS